MLGHGFDSRRLHLDEDETLRNVDMKRFIQLSRGYFFVVLRLVELSKLVRQPYRNSILAV